MQVILLLPCVRFQVKLLPGDPTQPTHLERAALHFIAHDKSVHPRELERFLGLGTAVFQDMLIRMFNRGWVRFTGPNGRLTLSRPAQLALDAGASNAPKLATTEEGKPFSLCYDLLGGGFAMISHRFLSKTLDHPEAVPRQPSGPEGQSAKAPYGKPFDGFLQDDPSFRDTRDARILRALQADRIARDYLQRIRPGDFPHLNIIRPGRALTLDDVVFYRCAFEVYSSVAGENGGRATIPVLECVEQRNIALRRLGELNADRIVECAIAARKGGDERLMKLLSRSGQAAGTRPLRSSNPMGALLDMLRDKGDEFSLEDIAEGWSLALDHLEMLLASRLDLKASGAVAPARMRGAVKALVESARNRLFLSSPQMRLGSAELSTEEDAVLGLIADARSRRCAVLVHGVKGTSARGALLSDDAAIMRVATALGSEQVDVVDSSLEHLRTALVAADGEGLLWQTTSVLSERQPSGLMLRLLPGRADSSVRRLGHLLPAGLRERIADRGEWLADDDAPPPPSDVARSARTVGDLLDRLSSEWTDLGSRAHDLQEFEVQVRFLHCWLKEESDSAEPVAGAAIRDRAAALLGPETDSQPVIIGIGGRGDSRAYTDLVEEIAHRLSRQDLSGIEQATTLVCLPEGPEFDLAAQGLSSRIGRDVARFEVLRQKARSDRQGPASFIMSPSSALIAQEGLVRFVPTIGRKTKGMHVGVHLHGRGARSLAAGFLAEQWVDCATRLGLPGAPAQIARPAMSQVRREQLRQEAQRGGWFGDGNRGATGALRFMGRTPSGPVDSTAEYLDDASTLLASTDKDERDLGYALMKAVVSLPGSPAETALAKLARLAATERNLVVTAILGDYLPSDSIYRDPLTRKLAFCAARQIVPDLTADDRYALRQPSPAILTLASLLMLDGVGGGLPEFLAEMDIEIAGEQAELTRALAAYVLEHGTGPIDLGSEGTPEDRPSVEETVRQLKALAEAGRTASTVGLVPQVKELRDLLFEQKGSFAADLFLFLSKQLEATTPRGRIAAVRAFFARAKAELGTDLFDAVQSTRRVKPDRLAEDYFERKNRQMQQQTRLELVAVNRSGRGLLSALKKIIALIVDRFIPDILCAADETRRALGVAMRNVASAPAGGASGEQAIIEALLRDRMSEAAAGQGFVRPPWELPSVPNGGAPDWSRLRRGYLRFEFERGTEFAEVVSWFLDQDDRRRDADGASWDDLLVRLVDLLESADAVCEPGDMAAANRAVDGHLREIAQGASQEIAKAGAFAKAARIAEGALPSSILRTGSALRALQESLEQDDVQGAVICADELRNLLEGEFHSSWLEQSDNMRAQLRAATGSDAAAAELDRRLHGTITSKELDQARTFVDLVETLTSPILYDVDCRLQISERNEAPAHTASLVKLLARLRGGTAGSPSKHEVQKAILAFFSNLDAPQLLAKISEDKTGWRVNCAHPDLTALNFGTSDEVDICMPSSQAGELTLRRQGRDARRGSGLLDRGRQGGKPHRVACHEIVLSPFFSDFDDEGLSVLSWRKLAQLGGLELCERRIGALAELSRRRFSASGSRLEWWSSLDEPSRLPVLQSILGGTDCALDLPLGKTAMAAHVRDLCLALGLFPDGGQRGETLRLSQRGAYLIAQAWRDIALHDEAHGFNYETILVRIVDRIISDAAG